MVYAEFVHPKVFQGLVQHATSRLHVMYQRQDAAQKTMTPKHASAAIALEPNLAKTSVAT